MKTITNLWGKSYSTEMVKITYNKTSTGYILISSLETPEGTDYWCQDYIFDDPLTYEAFKEIHNITLKAQITDDTE